MRLVAGVLALSLFASFARAEDTEEPRAVEPAGPAVDGTYRKVPLRVVRIMAQSRQALLFDRSRATHVLAEVGGKIGGYTVEAIDEDEVTLSFEGKQIVLVAPAHGGDRRHDRDLPAMRAPSAADARQADPVASEPAPIDPYRDDPVRVALAQGAPGGGEPGHAPRVIEAGQGGVRVAEAPGSTANPPTSSAENPAPHAVAPDARPADAGPADTRPAGIRVAEAPAGAPSAARAPSAAGASSAPDAPDAQTNDARAADAITKAADATAKANDARQGPQPAPTSDAESADATAGQGGIRVAEAPADVPGVPPAIEARAIEARAPEVKTPEVRAADAARAPDRQTLDARAMADVMSADHGSRGPRVPAAGALRAATPPPAADPRPAIPAPPVSDIRTASTAPGGTAVLSRSEVDGALADFAKLATAVRGSFTASGLVVDAVNEGSIFGRAGLRAGDVVTVVDGAPLRSLDAAANLYARASTAKAFTAQIIRGGSPMTLHVAIQ